MGDNVQVLHMGYLLVERSKLMEVRCEQAEGVDLGSNVSERSQPCESARQGEN